MMSTGVACRICGGFIEHHPGMQHPIFCNDCIDRLRSLMTIYKLEDDKKSEPCIHGNLCKELYDRNHVIYSTNCPNKCKYYEPKKEVVNNGS